VNINLTLFGQMISFALFVWFCMKFVWPPLIQVMRDRQKSIEDGLMKAEAAEAELEKANDAAALELDAAKKQSAELISQAQQRANQIVEDAKDQARQEADRIVVAAQAEVDREVSQAKEELRRQVGTLAVEGAEKILESTVDRGVHQDMLDKLAARL